MNRPTTAREALLAEAIGDVAQLIERLESLLPRLDRTRAALVEADALLVTQLDALEARMTAITENAKKRTVEHLARHADAVATRSAEHQTRLMADAARVPCSSRRSSRLGVRIQRLQRLGDGADAVSAGHVVSRGSS